VSEPFRYLLRVRYGECDAQGVVFNARWGDYIDIAVTEYTRALFGGVDVETIGMDWQLVKQTIEWKAPGRFDDAIECRVSTVRLGTTSFVLATELRRRGDGQHLASSETIYVAIDRAGKKQPLSDKVRAALERGASGVLVDHAGAARS
jgi:acyl-CoA thioester hydrolase